MLWCCVERFSHWKETKKIKLPHRERFLAVNDDFLAAKRSRDCSDRKGYSAKDKLGTAVFDGATHDDMMSMVYYMCYI